MSKSFLTFVNKNLEDFVRLIVYLVIFFISYWFWNDFFKSFVLAALWQICVNISDINKTLKKIIKL